MKIYIPFIGKVDAKKLILGLLAFSGSASAYKHCPAGDKSFSDQKACLDAMETVAHQVCRSEDRSQIEAVFALADPIYSPLDRDIRVARLDIQQFSYNAETGIASKKVRTLEKGVLSEQGEAIHEEEMIESQVQGKPVLRYFDKSKEGQLKSRKTSPDTSMTSYSKGLEEAGSTGIIVSTKTGIHECYGHQERRKAPGKIVGTAIR